MLPMLRTMLESSLRPSASSSMPSFVGTDHCLVRFFGEYGGPAQPVSHLDHRLLRLAHQLGLAAGAARDALHARGGLARLNAHPFGAVLQLVRRVGHQLRGVLDVAD